MAYSKTSAAPVWSAPTPSSTSARSGQRFQHRSKTSMPRNADHPHWGQSGERRIVDASPLWLGPTLIPLRIKHSRTDPAPLPVWGDIP